MRRRTLGTLTALVIAVVAMVVMGRAPEASVQQAAIHAVPVAGGGEGIERGAVVAPSIRARPIPRSRAATARPSALPKDAAAVFPGFNGDSIFVTLLPRPKQAVSATSVLSEVIRPVLRATGFPRQGAGSFSAAHTQARGSRRPGADMAALTADTCREFAAEPRAREGIAAMCAAFTGQKPPSKEVDDMLLNGRGMTFAQFKADLERRQIQYVFPQLVGKTPIEHVGLLASRWEGESITTVHGAIFTRFDIVNSRTLSFASAAARGARRVARLPGVRRAGRPTQTGALVLLPYGGTTARGVATPALRFAYRTSLDGTLDDGQPAAWSAYFDAATGAVLELTPLGGDEAAAGEIWRRDPTTATEIAAFTVDPPAAGQFTLQADDGTTRGIKRVDRLGDGDFNDGEVSVAGSAGTLANLNVAPINEEANAICSAGANNTFRQVNAFGHVSRMRRMVVNAGTVPPFPEGEMTLITDDPDPDGGGNVLQFFTGTGNSTLRLVRGTGFTSAACPNVANGSLPGTNDTTTIIHEFWHAGMSRLQERRPANWCGSPPCAMPSGRALFHDFSDALGHAYSSINCQAQYSRKNSPAANASLRCATHVEDGFLPRLSDVNVPFMPANRHDHFPEKRAVNSGDYEDGTIAAAALWQVRRGMRSKCLPSGTPQFFIRLIRALYNFGFVTSAGSGDRQIYSYLQDLLRQMAMQWATSGQSGGPPGFAHNGNHTTNKVTSGFARAGIFLVPSQCIDGLSSTTEPSSCPSSQGGENGGDAIVDIVDNDPGDDPTIDNVVHPENDWLRRAGPAPSFQVWTGPRFRFSSNSASGFTPSTSTPSPCHPQYQVELSNNQNFTGTVVTSTTGGTWKTVSTTADPVCFGTWTPSAAEWNSLRGASGDVKIHYRVRTRNAAGSAASERISTSPGNGLWTVPPAYAIVRDSGQP